MDELSQRWAAPFPLDRASLAQKSTRGIGRAQGILTVHAHSGPLIIRRGGDSNPRTRSTPVTRFPVAPVQPLRHLSGTAVSLAWRLAQICQQPSRSRGTVSPPRSTPLTDTS